MVVAYTDAFCSFIVRPVHGFRFKLSDCSIHLYAFLMSVARTSRPLDVASQFKKVFLGG